MRILIIIRVIQIYIRFPRSSTLYLCHARTTGSNSTGSNRPKYSSTHYTLRTILLNGCTDSHRRAIRRVVGGNRLFIHLQCVENRAVSSKPELTVVPELPETSPSPEVFKNLERSFYRTRCHTAKPSEKFSEFPSTVKSEVRTCALISQDVSL